MIGSKEIKRWSEVTPCMMSDEEEQGDAYVRHPPLYRSNILSQFIDKLDSRYEKRNSNTNHPRKARILGSYVTVPIPPDAKKWMLKPEMREKELPERDANPPSEDTLPENYEAQPIDQRENDISSELDTDLDEDQESNELISD